MAFKFQSIVKLLIESIQSPLVSLCFFYLDLPFLSKSIFFFWASEWAKLATPATQYRVHSKNHGVQIDSRLDASKTGYLSHDPFQFLVPIIQFFFMLSLLSFSFFFSKFNLLYHRLNRINDQYESPLFCPIISRLKNKTKKN